jgi:large subunit ribosomal protein L23
MKKISVSKNSEIKGLDIIKRPIITEKSMANVENKIYTFEVDTNSTKTNIKNSVEKIFNVKVKKINISNTKKKPKRVGKYEGYKSGYKKATVTLTSDSPAISAFEVE